MFTGIVEATAHVQALEPHDKMCVLVLAPAKEFAISRCQIGDSVSVSGVCLTLVSLANDQLRFDVSAETLTRTTLGNLRGGDRVNLESALRLDRPLGGHLVSGHVDGVGQVLDIAPTGGVGNWQFSAPAPLMRYIAVKGSITLNGVSLTVNSVEKNTFGLTLIPHTVHATNLGGLRQGDGVNLEVDLLARYLDRLLQARETSA
jgi:riboflavin synthase